MTNDKMLTKLNDQLHAELFSEYLYLSMAAWLDSQNLSGFAQFFKVQASEERTHAMKFYDYINSIGERVTLKAFEKPKSDFVSVEEVFEAALEHEQYITGRINSLVKLARENEEFKTEYFLSWFVNEQIEEEDTMTRSLEKVKAFSVNKGQLFMLDAQMGKRGIT